MLPGVATSYGNAAAVQEALSRQRGWQLMCLCNALTALSHAFTLVHWGEMVWPCLALLVAWGAAWIKKNLLAEKKSKNKSQSRRKSKTTKLEWFYLHVHTIIAGASSFVFVCCLLGYLGHKSGTFVHIISWMVRWLGAAAAIATCGLILVYAIMTFFKVGMKDDGEKMK